jgi:hypothetical protein
MKKSASADNFRSFGSKASSKSDINRSNDTVKRSQNLGSRPLEEVDIEDILDESRINGIVKSKSMGASLSEAAQYQ